MSKVPVVENMLTGSNNFKMIRLIVHPYGDALNQCSKPVFGKFQHDRDGNGEFTSFVSLEHIVPIGASVLNDLKNEHSCSF